MVDVTDYQNAKHQADGSITVDITVDLGGGDATMSWSQREDQFAGVFDQVATWLAANPGEIAAVEIKTLSEIVATSHATIVAMADALTRSLLSAYPAAEAALWISKEMEARAFMAIYEVARLPVNAPFIDAICQQQYGDETDSERLAHITEKAVAIVTHADAWRQLSAYVEGFRSRFDLLLEAASDAAEVAQLLATAEGEAAFAKTAFGL